ncbi:DHGL-like protein [Mya arenaria]|uniref:DHGL-like protein n=1 Tax=Mya arenaria TaxID=6604 RepID=A0ABY7FMI5_MYAAR|nr:DHGL-like protein [Mya arenaria]
METDTFKNVGVDTSKTKISFCSQFEYRSDAYWECYIRHISTTEYHPCCTAPMGPDNDNSAVLDLNLRVRGIANLRVVDASVFPNITSGNINAPDSHGGRESCRNDSKSMIMLSSEPELQVLWSPQGWQRMPEPPFFFLRPGDILMNQNLQAGLPAGSHCIRPRLIRDITRRVKKMSSRD